MTERNGGLMSDLIERQAVIEAIRKWKRYETTEGLVDRINNLPPAQPELIRCKDCKNSRFFDPCFYCYEFGEEINVPENGFCFMAKRREE